MKETDTDRTPAPADPEAETADGRAEARARNRPATQLESQDDLAYVAGQHDAKEAEKQVKTPAPRRSGGKAKEAARSERR